MDGEKAGTAIKTGDSPEGGRKGGTAWSNRTVITVIIVSMAAIAAIAIIVLTNAAAPRTPHLEAVISYDSATHTVIFSHNGGDPLPAPVRSLSVMNANGALISNTSPLAVYNTDGSEDITSRWSLGKYIRYTLDPSAGIPSGAEVVYLGPPRSILVSTRFTPVVITGSSIPAASPAMANQVPSNMMLPPSYDPVMNGSLRTSTLAVSHSGTDTPVSISYMTDTAGSGSMMAPFTLSRADAVNSSFEGTLTAPLQDCSRGGCMETPRYFSHWIVSGVISPEPIVHFTVLDNASWAAIAVYSDSLPCHCLGGKVWEDYTMDGVIDPGEPVLAGWTVSLYRQEGNTEVFVNATTTGADGTYHFLNIPYTDRHTIRVSQRTGWVQSYPLRGTYQNETLSFASRCRAIDLNFGNREILAANFTGEPTSGLAPLTVRFNDQSTGTPQSWLWNFGDGYTSSQQNPVYTYLTTGTYGVSLSVANSYGQNHQIQKTAYLTVSPPGVTVNLLLDASRGGYITAGGAMQFRVTGNNSYIQVGSTRYTLNATDIVRIVVKSDSAGSIYLTSASGLTSFAFPDVDLYINGKFEKSGEMSVIYIPTLDQCSSSLQLIIPEKGGKMTLTADGRVVESGTNDKSLTIRDVMPDSSYHSLNLDVNPYTVTFNGGATGYSLR